MRGNFTYLDNKTVLDVIQQAARKTYEKYGRYMDRDELVNEAHIALSTKGDLQTSIKTEQWGYLQNGLEKDLEHACLKIARRNGRNVHFETSTDGLGDASSVAQRRFSDVGAVGLRGVREDDLLPHEEAPVTIRKKAA